MKFRITKKVKNVETIFSDKKTALLNDKYVSTGYCSNGTPFLNKKEVPLLQYRKNANDSGGNLTKNLLHTVKNPIKMKHTAKVKQASNMKTSNMGSNTLKSIGVSLGNLFKTSVRMKPAIYYLTQCYKLFC